MFLPYGIILFDLVCMQGLRKTYQILRLHPNQASTRTVNVGNEKECDRDRKG